ncbi:MAG: type II secretion system F family protein [Desulfobacterales bacterium]
MNIFVIGAIIFFIAIIVIELSIYAVKNMRSVNRAKIRKRLRKHTYVKDSTTQMDIVKKRVLSEIPFFNRLLLKIPGVSSLDRLTLKANSKYPAGFYVLVALFLGTIGFMGVNFFLLNRLLSLIVAALLAGLPFLHLLQLKQKRIEKFRGQFPEALDLISRALRAGHSFNSGMKLAADEFDDPLGPEFDETLGEINFGVSVANALKNLAKRIECPELKYFVVAVILQRETGGNLSELIESLANLIREKFKFQGKVRTLSAEGKLSAVILVAIPFLIAIYLHFANPKYLAILFSEPIGRIMVAAAAIMMAIGILVMKKMVTIKV